MISHTGPNRHAHTLHAWQSRNITIVASYSAMVHTSVLTYLSTFAAVRRPTAGHELVPSETALRGPIERGNPLPPLSGTRLYYTQYLVYIQMQLLKRFRREKGARGLARW